MATLPYDGLVRRLPGFGKSIAVSQATARLHVPALKKHKIPFKAFFKSQRKARILAVYELSLIRFPEWLETDFKKLLRSNNIEIVLIVLGGRKPARDIAGSIAEKCSSMGLGLGIRCMDGARIVFPPKFRLRPTQTQTSESGHIPSWLIDKLNAHGTFSTALKRKFKDLEKKYAAFRALRNPTYDKEAELLDSFARSLAQGDPRLFFPYDSLVLLRQLERSGTGKKRDHYFHTFNNLFLGFFIFGECFVEDRKNTAPDKFIANGHRPHFQNPWESLWALTCLFHDPGYIAQEFWAGLDFTLGLAIPEGEAPPDGIPDIVVRRLQNSWQTGFVQTREDLVTLVHSLSGNWAPARLLKAESERIDSAIGKIFFDGEECGHSMISGLTLINRCTADKAAKGENYNAEIAHSACEIAALSMLFHDEHARTTYLKEALAPLSFESLPYAAVLVFVDTLQDDRRDIQQMRFGINEVLQKIEVDLKNRKIRAAVDLTYLPSVSWWPWKIAEYAATLSWLNKASAWKFEIDYQTKSFR